MGITNRSYIERIGELRDLDQVLEAFGEDMAEYFGGKKLSRIQHHIAQIRVILIAERARFYQLSELKEVTPPPPVVEDDDIPF
jgi:hypothetical protein